MIPDNVTADRRPTLDALREYAELLWAALTALVITPVVKFVRIVFGQRSRLDRVADDLAKLTTDLRMIADELRRHRDNADLHIDRSYDAAIREQILTSIQNLQVQLEAARAEIAAVSRERGRRG